MRTDLYAMGCVLFFLTTGKLPFKGTTPMELAQSRIKDTPTPIRDVRPDLPEWLEQVVYRALSRDPAQRHQTCRRAARSAPPWNGRPPLTIPSEPCHSSGGDRDGPAGKTSREQPARMAAISAAHAGRHASRRSQHRGNAAAANRAAGSHAGADAGGATDRADQPCSRPCRSRSEGRRSGRCSRRSRSSWLAASGGSRRAARHLRLLRLSNCRRRQSCRWRHRRSSLSPIRRSRPRPRRRQRRRRRPPTLARPAEARHQAPFPVLPVSLRRRARRAPHRREPRRPSRRGAPPPEVSVSFPDAKLLRVSGRRGEDFDAELRFGNGAIVVAPRRAGVDQLSLPYRELQRATFVRDRQPEMGDEQHARARGPSDESRRSARGLRRPIAPLAGPARHDVVRGADAAGRSRGSRSSIPSRSAHVSRLTGRAREGLTAPALPTPHADSPVRRSRH